MSGVCSASGPKADRVAGSLTDAEYQELKYVPYRSQDSASLTISGECLFAGMWCIFWVSSFQNKIGRVSFPQNIVHPT